MKLHKTSPTQNRASFGSVRNGVLQNSVLETETTINILSRKGVNAGNHGLRRLLGRLEV